MDADVMITVALCLEVFLFALAAGVFTVRGARAEAPENGRVHVEPAEMDTRPRPPASVNLSAAHAVPQVTARARRALRGVRS